MTNLTRKRIAAILYQMRVGYGYQIYKEYLRVFGKILMRTFYYNLKKGLSTGEFVLLSSKKERGIFTWGDEVKRNYYIVGPMYELPILTKEEMEKISQIKQNEIKDDPNQIRENYKKEVKEKLQDAIKRKDIERAKVLEKILSKINDWPPTPLFRVEKEI